MLLGPLESWSSEKSLATFHNDQYHTYWDGREVQKCAEDLRRYENILYMTEPEIVVEVGTRHGGSALWMHQRFGVDVISIDIAPQLPTPQSKARHFPNIMYLSGDSVNPALLEQVRQLTKHARVMVSLDGDHHAPQVWAEIQHYGALVTTGCYMVVEDACGDLWTGDDSRRIGHQIPVIGGPLKAMQLAGMADHPWWGRDEDVEGLFEVSHSPCGWWVRR